MAENRFKDEFASTARDITYPAFGGVLENKDETLVARGGSHGLKIYDRLKRDSTVRSALDKRVLAVISRPWDVDPASASRMDKKAAEMVKKQLSAINFDAVCRSLLDAILKGYSVAECLYSTSGAEVVLSAIRVKNARRFVFDDDEQLRMLTFDSPFEGVPVPSKKFIVHSVGSEDGSPYGLGLGYSLFWPVFFKKQDITFWLTFADKFAGPTVQGTFPAGTSEDDKDFLLEQLKNISQESAFIMPEGMKAELLEAAASGSSDFYEKMARYMDEQINLTILLDANGGQTSGGAIASSAIFRNEVRLELVQADADLLSETLNRTIVTWLTEFNCPGAKPPRVWRDVRESKNTKDNADRDKTICDMGFQPDEAYIKESYGQGWSRSSKPAGTQVSFSEPTFVVGPDVQQSDRLSLDAAPHVDSLIQQVLEVGRNAVSYAALRADLIAMYSELPDDDLQVVMQLAYAAADLAGRVDVKEGR